MKFTLLFVVVLIGICTLSVQVATAQGDDLESLLSGTSPSAETSVGSPSTGMEPPLSETVPEKPTVLGYMFRSLGWLFGPLFLFISIAAVALIVMNVLAIRREAMFPTPLIAQWEDCIEANDWAAAYEVVKDSDSFLGRLLATGLESLENSSAATVSAEIATERALAAMQESAEHETLQMENRLGLLGLIGNISPMIGLLGTVVGMVASFQTLAMGNVVAAKLAEGISTALVTTECGLVIAVPVIIFYEIYKNRLAELIIELSILSGTLFDSEKLFAAVLGAAQN